MSNTAVESFELSKFETMLVAVQRLDMAKDLFAKEGILLQAKRVRKAYKALKVELKSLLYSCEEEHRAAIINFIFHIEDWLELYEQSLSSTPKRLLDPIKLNLLNHSVEYPSDWIAEIRGKYDEPNWHHEQLKW